MFMNSLPLVSIIVPIYNVADYLEKSINSIIHQTYTNLEIILIDDGSTDDSSKILQLFSRDPRINIITKTNTGQSDCRYIGYQSCTGEFVYFMDSDDTLELEAIEILVNNIIDCNSDFCCCGYKLVDESGTILKLSPDFKNHILPRNDLILSDALKTSEIKSTLWTKLFRKSFLENNDLYPVKEIPLHDDCMFTYLCSIYANRVSFVNEQIYNALQRDGSISRKCKPIMVTIYDKIFRILKEELSTTNKLEKYTDDFYWGYGKSVLYAMALAVIRCKSYEEYKRITESISSESIYYSKEFTESIKKTDLKLFLLYILSRFSLIYYYTFKLLKNRFQH